MINFIKIINQYLKYQMNIVNYYFVPKIVILFIDDSFVKYLLKRKKCRKRVIFKKVKQ